MTDEIKSCSEQEHYTDPHVKVIKKSKNPFISSVICRSFRCLSDYLNHEKNMQTLLVLRNDLKIQDINNHVEITAKSYCTSYMHILNGLIYIAEIGEPMPWEKLATGEKLQERA